MRLASAARNGQPIPNLLFGAVYYLLLKGYAHKLREFFHLYNNMWDAKLHLDYFIDGIEHNEIVAETDGHARWFRWELSVRSFR